MNFDSWTLTYDRSATTTTSTYSYFIVVADFVVVVVDVVDVVQERSLFVAFSVVGSRPLPQDRVRVQLLIVRCRILNTLRPLGKKNIAVRFAISHYVILLPAFFPSLFYLGVVHK